MKKTYKRRRSVKHSIFRYQQTQPTPDTNARTFRHEYYGGAGIYGHKIWVNVTQCAPGHFALIPQWFSKYYGTLPVELNGQEFTPTELTVFLYLNREPETDQDNWTADQVHNVDLTAVAHQDVKPDTKPDGNPDD